MDADPAFLLLLLQHGDSAFPSGAFAFSWGLEGLAADGLVTGPDDVTAMLEDQLRHRWATADRIALRRAYAARSLDEVAAVDEEVELTTLAAPLREGSRRAGQALLGVHARLGTPSAAEYRARLDPARAGHLAAVQGLVWSRLGLPLPAAEALSAWGLVSAVTSAAVRLGLLGHLQAQSRQATLRPLVALLLADEPAPDAAMHAFTPLADIALARHAGRDVRLFAT